ncbi:MAG: hypothetical protein FDZ69_13140 [Deltaproteobacteria bacterium]|nr:MAG: hypothetical protein FDZ69_13140 [Deltaproteobacteria bacterium]
MLHPARTLTWLLLVALAAAAPVLAEDPSGAPPVEMDAVTVTGTAADRLTGSSTLDRDTLQTLPARNGSLNEMLTILPGIQAGEFSRTSDNAGEILPPNLSISGGRFYDNNFTIDGIGNNSLLDPAYENTRDLSRVPGHPQESFIHPSLIENVTVYRSNIPARFGAFTGGVVEARTRDPRGVFGGQFSLRHTRSEWTELHVAREREAEYTHPTSGNVQPEFRKYDGALSIDLPLSENSGLLAAASRIRSDIPLVLVDETEEQHRTLDNYFLKYVAHLTPDSRLTLTGSYTPYSAEMFLPETVASRYDLDNDAYGLTAKLESRLSALNLELNLNRRESRNRREAPASYFPWQVTPSKPWGDITDADVAATKRVSKEGGHGDLEQRQETWTATIDATTEPLQTAGLAHVIGFGASYEQVTGTYERPRDMTYYSGVCGPNTAKLCTPVKSKIPLYQIAVCDPGDPGCISGEQFMYQKTVYPADTTDAVIRFYDAYLEDAVTWGRLTVRPGVRLSSDDLQKNDNWAPRLAVSLDPFGDGRTVFRGGWNRYYGKTLLTHALAEKRAPSEIWKRDNKTLAAGSRLKPWTFSPKKVFPATRLADLATPYTDEWTVGISQQAGGGLLSLDYIDRESRDELYARVRDIDADGYLYTEWTNDGRSDHREVALSWEQSWQNHAVLLSATWQETVTSNGNYDTTINEIDRDKDGTPDPVWYRGSIVDRDNLPRTDFNREWTAALAYSGRLPWGFTFTNVTRYRSGYAALANTGEDKVLPSGEKLDIYDVVDNPESWVFDWRLDWEKRLWREQSLVLTVEINNVFDEEIVSGETLDTYDLGRQIWVGMTYKF